MSTRTISPTTTAPTASAAPPEQGRTAPAVHERSGTPRLRLVPGAEATQLSLPYEYDIAPGIPAIPSAAPDLRTVTAEEPPADDLPDIRRWAAQMARAIAEVAVGERPPGQLTRWVERNELARLARRGQHVQRHPAARAQRGVSRLRSVRAVRTCPVAPGVVETSAVIVGGDRAHAIAIRFEAVGGRWLATVVQLG
jgi:hypothetical protein